jgi:hypothetical protein
MCCCTMSRSGDCGFCLDGCGGFALEEMNVIRSSVGRAKLLRCAVMFELVVTSKTRARVF